MAAFLLLFTACMAFAAPVMDSEDALRVVVNPLIPALLAVLARRFEGTPMAPQLPDPSEKPTPEFLRSLSRDQLTHMKNLLFDAFRKDFQFTRLAGTPSPTDPRISDEKTQELANRVMATLSHAAEEAVQGMPDYAPGKGARTVSLNRAMELHEGLVELREYLKELRLSRSVTLSGFTIFFENLDVEHVTGDFLNMRGQGGDSA
ncbi:MAG: hypothetical protein M1829_000289 [Trizodia sp. TS-e1964]|nr:MAG: hypothetical protein M1829_000289 [Trizodia sp. TS-e1964]